MIVFGEAGLSERSNYFCSVAEARLIGSGGSNPPRKEMALIIQAASFKDKYVVVRFALG